MNYQHQCVHQACLEIDDPTINGMDKKIHLLMGAVAHLQAHCAHLQAVLVHHGITLPIDNEVLEAENIPIPLEEQNVT